VALSAAVLTTAAVFAVVWLSRPGPLEVGTAKVGEVAPEIEGQTLDGTALRLADFRGRPVIVNFWGPSCIPCRDEFPLLKAKLTEHAGDDLALIGVLINDPPEPARAFVAEQGATWPTVVDGDRYKRAYLVTGWPQTYFIDANGVIRAAQIGEVNEAIFDAKYSTIAPS
jgi:cytochrome c biogenesis protein CcmG, thiol:disulfide interchange protein DsbE